MNEREKAFEKIRDGAKKLSGAYSGRLHDHYARMLEGGMELLDLGNRELAKKHDELTEETKQLQSATRRLWFATWILVVATTLLFFVKGYEAVRYFADL